MTHQFDSQCIKIMSVERGTDLANRLRALFPDNHATISREASMDRVLERFETQTFDVLIIAGDCMKAGEVDGIDLLEVISAKSPTTQVLFLVHPREIRLAMSALKAGSYQYAKLPIPDDELKLLITTALERRPKYGPNLLLKREKSRTRFEMMVGRSQAMHEVYRQIRQAAATDIPVLLAGETGTGKDLAAQAIHRQSDRHDKAYVPVHLGALPPELVASELFGHEKGSFTGASEQRIGRFEQANHGTVFLDEIAMIDEKVQVTLLRLIEHRRLHRIGGRRKIAADARLVAASNSDLAEAVRLGTFREDLFFRLDVFQIVVPPLRDRHGDIPLLIDAFVKRYNEEFQKNILGISPECVALLESYDWPGNVRELKNVIQRAVLVCTGEVLLPPHLPPRLRPGRPRRPTVAFEVGASLADIEREMIQRTLESTGNNKKRTAELLGISRRALYNKIRRHRLA